MRKELHKKYKISALTRLKNCIAKKNKFKSMFLYTKMIYIVLDTSPPPLFLSPSLSAASNKKDCIFFLLMLLLLKPPSFFSGLFKNCPKDVKKERNLSRRACVLPLTASSKGVEKRPKMR